MLPNLPQKLNAENDYLQLIPKAEQIKFFLDKVGSNGSEISMLSLFGEWGSGKTTMFDYLERNIGDEYKVFLFEAWKFEKDNNLAYSLVDFMIDESDSKSEKFFKDFGNASYTFLKGFAKSISVSVPGITFSPKDAIDDVEKEAQNEKYNFSFYRSQKKFIELFEEFETKISKKKKILILIDDLDRCEPDNVLNLLSAIKLFFTYGKKSVFLCGIDKNAVKGAVKVRYGDIIKSEEYLEKIFDFTFNMPKNFSLELFVKQYFPKSVTSSNIPVCRTISNFFKILNFTNPRHLIKVLNKYEHISLLLNDSNGNSLNIGTPNPNLICYENGSVFETLLLLFMICLFEFENDSFEIIYDIDKKREIIIEQNNQYDKTKPTEHRRGGNGSLEVLKNKLRTLSLQNVQDQIQKQRTNSELHFQQEFINGFIIYFTPTDIEKASFKISNIEFINQFQLSKQELLLNFCNYLFCNISILEEDNFLSNCSLDDFFKLVRNIS